MKNFTNIKNNVKMLLLLLDKYMRPWYIFFNCEKFHNSNFLDKRKKYLTKGRKCVIIGQTDPSEPDGRPCCCLIGEYRVPPQTEYQTERKKRRITPSPESHIPCARHYRIGLPTRPSRHLRLDDAVRPLV